MTTVQDINDMYEARLASLVTQQGELDCNNSLIMRLMRDHVNDLTDHIRDLMRKQQRAEQRCCETEEAHAGLASQLDAMAAVLRESEDELNVLRTTVSELTCERKIREAASQDMADRLETVDKQNRVYEKEARKQEELISSYKRELEKLFDENENAKKDNKSNMERLKDTLEELSEMCSYNQQLEQVTEELEHALQVHKDALVEDEDAMLAKEEELQCLARGLDEAQARILEWQQRALAGDEAVLELECLNDKIQKLVPELEDVCINNEELKHQVECLKGQLSEAQDEADCLREKVYTVACECADLDQRLALVTEHAQLAAQRAAAQAAQRAAAPAYS